MKRLRIFVKRTTIITVVIALAIGVTIVVFLVRNDAPIISGDVERGIVYKNDIKLDIYRPTNVVFKTSPVLFYIHGGAWIRGSREAINFNRFNGAVNTLRDQGYTIIAPDYSLAGKTKTVFPDCLLDIYDAIEWTKNNAGVYDLDITNLGILGESAGAHIAMMAAFSETTLVPDKYKKTNFNYLIDVYGPNDLTDLYNGPTVEKIDATLKKVSKIFGSEFNIRAYVFGFDPSKDTVRANELLTRFSPVNFVEQTRTPVLIIHGTEDQIVPVEQSINLKRKMDELGIAHEIHLLDSVDHNFIKASRGQMDSTQVWIRDFVVRHYKPSH